VNARKALGASVIGAGVAAGLFAVGQRDAPVILEQEEENISLASLELPDADDPESDPASRTDQAAAPSDGTRDGRRVPQWPENMESRIYEYLAGHSELGITSIPKVECASTRCEIQLTGYRRDPGAQEWPKVLDGMPWYWGVVRVRLSERELSPGFEVLVLELFNQSGD
jgi:hypothetical protein